MRFIPSISQKLEESVEAMSTASMAVVKDAQSIEESVNKLLRVFKETTKMAQLMSEVTKRDLEAVKGRLRCLEVNKNSALSNSLLESGKRRTDNLEAVNGNKKIKPNENTENSNLNKELEEFKRNIEKEVLVNAKLNIKRDYKLTQKSNFDIWFDYLKSDLTSHNLIDVLDANMSSNDNLSESIMDKRKCYVRDIIINHLDKTYHRKILNVTDPVEILKKLKGQRKDEINITSASVRKNLYLIKMKKNESVNEFCERFDGIVREYEACGDGVALTKQELR